MTTKQTIRSRALEYLKNSGGPLTADEVAAGIGKHFLSVRPRIAELNRDGLVRDTGSTRLGALGKQASLWEAV